MSFYDPHHENERRRQEIARVNSVTGGVFEVGGHFEISGSSASHEAQTDIAFPVSFVELPLFTFGYSLDDSQAWTVGSFPTCSGVVGQWDFILRQETGNRSYTGATLLVVVTGLADQIGLFHYKFEGKAIPG